MAPGFVVFVLSLTIAQLALPRNWAFLPLVIAACHMGNIEILPELTTARLLILVGLGRAVSGGFAVLPSKESPMDRLFMVFAFLAILSTVGHKADAWIPSPLNARLGMVLNILGCYLYGRTYLPNLFVFRRYVSVLPIILIPLGILMSIEQQTKRNLYFMVGAARSEAATREDKVRAQGPFRHPILAGCAGATTLPFAFLLWQVGRRKTALLGTIACMAVVLACSSSGPLAAVAVTVVSTILWYWRRGVRLAFWGLMVVALVFSLHTGQGPWHLMSRMDLVGGSTGWHRAHLIDQGFKYLDEWWLWGTDYTRHWMPFGVSWSPNQSDITNYFLHLGVIGGLPLTLCLFAFIGTALRLIARGLAQANKEADILLWCAAASLGAHAISFVSISYFDQMYIFFYLLLGAIPGLVSGAASQPAASALSAAPLAEEPAPAKPLRYYS